MLRINARKRPGEEKEFRIANCEFRKAGRRQLGTRHNKKTRGRGEKCGKREKGEKR
jgi:hypothetical protein